MKLTNLKLGACLAALALAGCQKAPAGQVAMTVNGDDVTVQEINSEAQTLNLPATVDKEKVKPALAQRVLERTLLADAAKERGLDKSVDYINQTRRAEQSILASLLAKQIGDKIGTPTRVDANKFITEHPLMFAQRTQFALDQIRFPLPANMQILEFLKPAKTMEAVAEGLQQRGIKFERGNAALDSATNDPALIGKVATLPPGEPFFIPFNGVGYVSVIKAKQNAPLDGESAVKIATEILRRETLQKEMKKALDDAKAKAKVKYQKGFEPPKGAAASALPSAGGEGASAPTAG